MGQRFIQLEEGWRSALHEEFDKAYMRQLRAFLVAEKSAGKTIYPPGAEIFSAFNLTPLKQTKVVIIGQDPYHGDGQAHGLCFSVKGGIKPPPSLKNIYKELATDVDAQPVDHGYLSHWARQGVFLVNATLTVERKLPGSHANIGWQTFTDQAIRTINAQCNNVVFMLWGSFAQKKESWIDQDRHLVLKAAHPSPFSAHRGFLGCHHFSKANAYLLNCQKTGIDWQLPPNP